MRTKIDNLVLFNLFWLIIAIAYAWVNTKSILFIEIAGSIMTLLYGIYLFKRTSGHVEQSAKFRLRKRIVLNVLQSLSIAIIALSVLLNL